MKEKETKKLTAEERKLDLLSINAHQLLNSLTASKWSFKMFLDGDLGKLTEEQRNIIEKLNENNEQMISTVEEMLKTYHIENAGLEYNFEKDIDLVKLIEKTKALIAPECLKREIEIEFKKPKESFPKVTIDKEKIAVVIQNLIGNAVKYSKSKDKVTVTLEKRKDEILISVEDHGIGISEKDKANVFEKSFRTANAKQKEISGAGLGLFISKRFVEEHGGKIWFESPASPSESEAGPASPKTTRFESTKTRRASRGGEESHGTTFYFTIPIT